MNIRIFLNITLCRLLNSHRRFGEAYYLHSRVKLHLQDGGTASLTIIVPPKSIQYELFKPVNAELNPICHLLASLGAHHILHILHVSRVMVKQNEHK